MLYRVHEDSKGIRGLWGLVPAVTHWDEWNKKNPLRIVHFPVEIKMCCSEPKPYQSNSHLIIQFYFTESTPLLITNTNWLPLFREIVLFYPENDVSAYCRQATEMLYFQTSRTLTKHCFSGWISFVIRSETVRDCNGRLLLSRECSAPAHSGFRKIFASLRWE
jgi:hypothetical protein